MTTAARLAVLVAVARLRVQMKPMQDTVPNWRNRSSILALAPVVSLLLTLRSTACIVISA